ncbi:MAG: hypothetical protein JW787_11750 [Sedimentisphaerales bacterium]|nr:hypothetical protein [Sedimentisphaerales bacterium]
MKLRIAAAAVVGVVLIGIVAWPSQSPPDPFGSLVFKEIGASGAVTLLIMAFLAGLISYFAAWPYGREIGILSVPFGLCIWAIRAGSTGGLMQLNPTAAQRSDVLAALRWEPLFWLLVLACGFAGVILGQRITARLQKQKNIEKVDYTPVKLIYMIISALLSGVIVIFCIRLFARDVAILDSRLEYVPAQPALGQIIFAVLLSFGIAAFAIKMLFNVSYIWPIISCAFITAYTASSYANSNILAHFVQSYPALFFPNSVISILPVQMVTFGTIGSIAGYWMAVRYSYWRKHEM